MEDKKEITSGKNTSEYKNTLAVQIVTTGLGVASLFGLDLPPEYKTIIISVVGMLLTASQLIYTRSRTKLKSGKE